MRLLRTKCSLIVMIALLYVSLSSANAFEVDTHRRLNEKVALEMINGFSLDAYLRTQLGFVNGVEEKFKAIKVTDWIKNGGELEDNGLRFFHHFHNPLRPWDHAGFKDIYSSLILWAQTPVGSQSLFGDWSWQDARDYFYKALTSTTDADRQRYFADTFRAVGQLMHLVEDLSVPAHTRNDAHLFYNYEKWVLEQQVDQFLAIPPISFDPYILNLPANLLAPIPIAGIFDTDRYDGTNPDITAGQAIGLSEYTNANFYSEDTMDSSFPFPRFNSVQVTTRDFVRNSGETYTRQYYLKNLEGETNAGQGYLLAAVDYLDFYRQQHPDLAERGTALPAFDSNVYGDYARLLIPRAVGYAAGLMQHFFRGEIGLTPPDRFVYGITSAGGAFQQIRIKAKNITTTGEEMFNGQVQLVVMYKQALEDPYQANLSAPVPTSENFSYIVVPEQNGVRSIPRDIPVELVFDLSATPLPLQVTDVYVQVVYRGVLGSEQDAVVVGYKDISEPTPIDVINSMDYVCVDGRYLIAGSSEAFTAADTNQNGQIDLLYPDNEPDPFAHGLSNAYLKFSSPQSPQPASSSNYNARFASINPAMYGRIFILADYDFYFSERATPVVLDSRDISDPNIYIHFIAPVAGTLRAVKNQTEVENGRTIQHFAILNPVVRGLPIWLGIDHRGQNFPGNVFCDDNALFALSPPVSGPVGVDIP